MLAEKLFSHWVVLKPTQKNSERQQGFFLLELALAAAVAAVCAQMLFSSMAPILGNWRLQSEQRKLEEGARYIFTQMEREMGVSSTEVALSKSGSWPVVNSQHITAAKSLRFYHNSSYNNVYKRTSKLVNNTYGINPASLADSKLTAWEMRRLTDNAVLVSLTLQSGESEQSFSHVIYCANASISSS